MEYRPPDLNAHNPRIAAQDLAEDTCQGRIVQGVNAHKGLTAILVDAANTDNGQIRRWYTLDASKPYGLAQHDLPEGAVALDLSAWRLRNLLLEDGDPTAFVDGRGYNSHAIRKRLSTRTGVIGVLDEIGLSDEQRIEGEVIRDGQITEWLEGYEVFIKPFGVSDVSEHDPNYRAQLAPNDRAEVERRVRALGGQAILQPRLEVMRADHLLRAVGVKTDQEQAPSDALHVVRLYDFLWRDEAPTVAEVRLTDPQSNIGALYATHSELLEAERVRAAFPEMATLHDQVREGLRATLGKLGSLAMNYLILPGGRAKIVSADARAFTPDLTDENPQRQALSRSLAEAEVEELVVLARNNFLPSVR